MTDKKPKRRIMRALKINEISGVDNPAQQGAIATIMKRNDGQDFEKYASGPAVLTTSENGHSHVIYLNSYDGVALNGGTTSHQDDHSHPWIMDPDGNVVIGEARGHTHGVQAMSKTVNGNQGDNDMTKTNDTDNRVKELEAELAKSNAINAMDADTRAYFDSLDDAGKDDFLAKSADERSADIAKAAEGKAVVFKAADGTEYTKADDPRLVQMAKDRDADRKRLEDAEKRAAEADLRKRADDLAHIPGTTEDRMAMLKAIDGIPDEAARKRSLEALTAQNEAIGKATVTHGHVAATPEAGSAEAQLDELAKKHAADNDMSEAAAYDAVLKTARGQELYAQTVSN